MPNKATIRQARYDSTHCTGYYLKLNNVNDSDIIDKLSKLESKQGYIKQLIRDDLSRTCSGNTVSVPLSEAAMSILKEIAKSKGLSVPKLIAVTVDEQLIRTCFREGKV